MLSLVDMARDFFRGRCRKLSVDVEKSYHIKDDFFALVGGKNDGLMQNKENGQYRPHYFCLKDTSTEGIYWAIPQSTQTEKYEKLRLQKIEKDPHNRCDTIIIGNYNCKPNAFLIQNMFPIIDKYIDHEHTVGGASVTIHQSLSEEIKTSAFRVLSLHRRGCKLMFPDVDKIYQIMKSELASNT